MALRHDDARMIFFFLQDWHGNPCQSWWSAIVTKNEVLSMSSQVRWSANVDSLYLVSHGFHSRVGYLSLWILVFSTDKGVSTPTRPGTKCPFEGHQGTWRMCFRSKLLLWAPLRYCTAYKCREEVFFQVSHDINGWDNIGWDKLCEGSLSYADVIEL